VSRPGKDGAPKFDVLQDLWEHDPRAGTWAQVEASGPVPPDRAYHAAVFDAARGALWVFGGADRGLRALDDLWRYDVAKRSWEKVEPAGERPPAGFSGVLLHDPERDRLVLHGGCRAFLEKDSVHDRTWTFDLAARAWTKRAAGPGRWQAAAALAPELDLVVLQGGYDANFTPQSDAWAYDLERDAWSEIEKGPKATDAHVAFWDAPSEAFVFHGGATAGKRALDGLWAYDPRRKRWKELASAKGDGPGPRAYHAAAWLPDGSLWVFGGTVNQFLDPMNGGEVWIAKVRK
jgi:N-acetylneuraminic acid mutarotase